MYNIIVSQGVVLKKQCVGESNAVVSLLTESHGLIRAQVRSARVERSKLRYGIEPLTIGKFSLVCGQHQWRITGIEHIQSFAGSIPAQAAAARIVLLLLRLVQGQEPIPAVYQAVAEGLKTLQQTELSSVPPIEWVLVLRILAHLGYVSAADTLLPFLTDNLFTSQLLSQAQASRHTLIRMINMSLRASDL